MHVHAHVVIRGGFYELRSLRRYNRGREKEKKKKRNFGRSKRDATCVFLEYFFVEWMQPRRNKSRLSPFEEGGNAVTKQGPEGFSTGI